MHCFNLLPIENKNIYPCQQGLNKKDVQSALTTTFGEDCPIAPVLDYVSVPEEVSGAVGTVSASVTDVNKVNILTLRFSVIGLISYF